MTLVFNLKNVDNMGKKKMNYLIPRVLTKFRIVAIMIAILYFAFPVKAQVEGVKHVILIGVDGMGANYLSKAKDIPNMKMMMKEGSYSMHARSVRPSSSAVNWASMTMGATPSLTGYTKWNSRSPEIPSRVLGKYNMFPTIFEVLKTQKPEARIGVIYSWLGIGYLFPKEVMDRDIYSGDHDSVTLSYTQEYIKKGDPTLLFLHFHAVDKAGHHYGWGTDEYYNAIARVDKCIGGVIQAVQEAGIMDNTIILVSADHGGKGKGHGGISLDEMEIPWIIYGRGIKEGNEIKDSIMTFDTASTIAYIFDLKQPQVWTGKPITAAFK